MSDVIDEVRPRETTGFGRREGTAARSTDESWFEESDGEAEDYDALIGEGIDDDPAPRRRRSRAARRPGIVALNFLMTCGVLGLIGAGAAALYGKSLYERPGPLAKSTNFVVREGATLNAVARELERRGIILDDRVFVYAARLVGNDRGIKTGEFALPANASMRQVMDELVDGRPVEFRVTVPEGFTVYQALQRIAAHPELTGDMPGGEIREGMLAAETISFARGESRANVVERLKRIQAERIEKAWASRSATAPIDTPDNLVTLASLVEKETAIPRERRDVAAVYANRIRQNWHLNADPTVIYGVYGGEGLPPGKSITKSDLRNDNLYNTYILRGLPAGPVAIPGEAALMAAANPSDLKAMFFVADGSGGHIFADTLEEHNRNVAQWRKVERGEVEVERTQTRSAAAAPVAEVATGTAEAAPSDDLSGGSSGLTGDEVAALTAPAPATGAEPAAPSAEAAGAPAGQPAAASTPSTPGTPAPGTPVPLMRPR